MKRRFIAALIALVMTLALVPISFAEPARDWTVPEGYNENDYNKAAAFLEQTDGSGVRNGKKLSPDYDPTDPGTWGEMQSWDNNGNPIMIPRFEWVEDTTGLRLHNIQLSNTGMCGNADFSECALLWVAMFDGNDLFSADFHNCPSLDSLDLAFNLSLSEFDVQGCTALNYFNVCFNSSITSIEGIPDGIGFIGCGYTSITELDLSRFYRLYSLEAAGCALLTKLDASSNSELGMISCWSCALTELILPDNKETLQVLDCFDNNLTELKLGYPHLVNLQCHSNNLSGKLDLKDHSELLQMTCYNNNLNELDLTGCSALQTLICNNNQLTSLDISDCTMLNTLDCSGNHLTILDLTNNPSLPLASVQSTGNGFIGYINAYVWNESSFQWEPHTDVCASPADGETFMGWYRENGEFVSAEHVMNFIGVFDSVNGVAVARFSGGSEVVGDVNGDGAVTSDDALLVMRSTLGLTELTSEQNELADINGDGIVNLVDALLILRRAMGLV